MSDLGRDGAGSGVDEDRLPWLEPVDDEDMPEGGVAAGKLIGALIAALVAIGLIIGGSFWLRQRNTEVADNGGPATIPAPPGPYKIKPADAGGMKVPGQGDASYSAVTGADPNAQIDMNAVAEAPIATKPAPKPVPATPPAPPPTQTASAAPAKPGPAPAKPAPAPTKPVATAAIPSSTTKLASAAPAPKPSTSAAKPTTSVPASGATSGPAVQLGSFSSQAKADAAWKSLSGRFSYLGGLTEQVVTGTVGGNTVYRLRASGAGASGICSKLKVAGETCIIAQQ